jgi:hypothetical protein
VAEEVDPAALGSVRLQQQRPAAVGHRQPERLGPLRRERR